MMDYTVDYTVSHIMSAQRVADMMTGCVENNFMTQAWCDGIYLVSKEPERHPDDAQYPWYCSRNLWASMDFKIEVKELGYDSIQTHIITRDNFEKGLKVMAEKYPNHLADILQENDDNVTQDVFLQCVVLGEIIYG